MLCSNCKLIEMRVDHVEGNMATHVCKKCGLEVTEELPKEPPQEVENEAE